MFLEKVTGLAEGQSQKRIILELCQYLKSKIIGDAFKIVAD